MAELELEPVHFSSLKLMGRSPAHYRAGLAFGRPDTPALRFGRLVHSLALTGRNGWRVYDGVRRGKAWEAELCEAEGDAEKIVSPGEYERALAVASAVRQDTVAAPLLEGVREREIAWKHAGRDCAGRPDVVSKDGAIVVDLKTSNDVSPSRFPRRAGWLGYHAQLDWYRHGLKSAGLAEVQRCYLVTVETRLPFAVVVYEVTRESLELGHRLWRSWFERLLACEGSNCWPGYSAAVVPWYADQNGTGSGDEDGDGEWPAGL